MNTPDEVKAKIFRNLGTDGKWPVSSEEIVEAVILILLSNHPVSPEFRAYTAACVDGWRHLIWMPKRERDKFIAKLRKAELDAEKQAIIDMIYARSTLLPREND